MNGRLLVREDQEAAMDCEHAREQLDVTRPDIPEREDSELQAAFEHLNGCPACAEVYDFRRAFDRRMRTVVRQVMVPADLQERLKSLVASASAPVAPATVDSNTTDPRPSSRTSRRAVMLATSAAALLIAAGWTWVVNHQPPAPLLSATVFDWWEQRLSAPDKFSVESLPEFNADFEPVVADGRWQGLVTGAALGVDFDDDGRQDGAVFPIKGGFLVVLPPGRVTDPPSAASAVSAISRYAPAPHVAWTQGGSLHICYLPGGSPDQLERLLNQVNRAA